MRQKLSKPAAQFARRQRGVTCIDNIGNQQSIASGVQANVNRRLSNGFMLFEHTFDLTGFNPETTNFHLCVAPAQNFQLPALRQSTFVASLV